MNAQLLFDLVKANEAAIKFDLGRWFGDCGTWGCLVGNHACSDVYGCLYRERGFWKGEDAFGYLGRHYGVTEGEARFLFDTQTEGRRWSPELGKNRLIEIIRNCHNREDAINRVRKFIYYKLHKQELMEDPKVRNMEGDHYVVNKAAKRVACAASV